MRQPGGPTDVVQLYKRELAPLKGVRVPKLRTIQDWYSRGSKYAAIAGGGEHFWALSCMAT